MNYKLVTAILFTLAVINVLIDRLLLPALLLVFKAIEQSFAPQEPALQPIPIAAGVAPIFTATERPAITVTPVANPVAEAIAEELTQPTVVKAVANAPRKARRRRPSAKTLAAIEAIT